MYFYFKTSIKYDMLTKKRIVLLIILVAVCVAVPVMAAFRGRQIRPQTEEMQVITLWQIDSFEGGKGSRAQYLQNKATALFEKRNCYVTVTSVSAESARKNIQSGNIPDMISYGAGFYGIDSYVNRTDFYYRNWCRGGYCLLKLGNDGDFSDVSADNTVVNAGKDNLAEVCAVLTGIGGADIAASTSAYVSLIGGKYKYLLGTQRDIYRLRTRGVSFSVNPVSAFNDLYQNISILTSGDKYQLCLEFIDYLMSGGTDVINLGLFRDGFDLYDDELRIMEDVRFEYTLKSFVGEKYIEDICAAAKSGDINLLKNLLK